MTNRLLATRRVVATCTIALLATGVAACGSTGGETSAPPTASVPATAEGALALEDGWVKAATAGMTAMFGTLRNPTDHPVTVTGGNSPAAAAVELHETTKSAEGAMQMQPKPGGFTVPAGGELVLQPGGEHVMLMGLTTPLESGTTATVTLATSDGDIVLTVPVRSFAGAEESYVPTPSTT